MEQKMKVEIWSGRAMSVLLIRQTAFRAGDGTVHQMPDRSSEWPAANSIRNCPKPASQLNIYLPVPLGSVWVKWRLQAGRCGLDLLFTAPLHCF